MDFGNWGSAPSARACRVDAVGRRAAAGSAGDRFDVVGPQQHRGTLSESGSVEADTLEGLQTLPDKIPRSR